LNLSSKPDQATELAAICWVYSDFSLKARLDDSVKVKTAKGGRCSRGQAGLRMHDSRDFNQLIVSLIKIE